MVPKKLYDILMLECSQRAGIAAVARNGAQRNEDYKRIARPRR